MFSLVSGIYDYAFAPTKLNLLVVGASGTGKTALLERLKVTQFTKNPKPSLAVGQPLDDVPQSFLPLSSRQAAPTKTLKKKKKEKRSKQAPTTRRGFLACPAPSRYQKQESDDEEIEDDDEEEDDNNDDGNDLGNSTRSLEEIALRNDSEHQSNLETTTTTTTTTNTTTSPEQDADEDQEEEEDDEDQQQHDLKNKKIQMLPLHKIRPTIGMNLGKLEMCGAQCNVWDLGGKMHDLWSRYYPDCDAVVFVWKIVDDGKLHTTLEDGNADGNNNNNNGNDSDSSDDWPSVTAAQQLALLEQVRNSIADDVPFLVLGHWFPPSPTIKKDPSYQYNEAYSTDTLLPRYHNPLMSVFFGSARSGAGVRTAMEWLIPVAARQKKFRDKSAAVTTAADDAKE